MSHFPERIECMMLQKRFNETLFNIGEYRIPFLIYNETLFTLETVLISYFA